MYLGTFYAFHINSDCSQTENVSHLQPHQSYKYMKSRTEHVEKTPPISDLTLFTVLMSLVTNYCSHFCKMEAKDSSSILKCVFQ